MGSGVVRDCNSGWDQVGCRAPGAWTRAWLWCWCDFATWATLQVHQCLQRTRALIGCCRALMASCDGGSGVYLNDGCVKAVSSRSMANDKERAQARSQRRRETLPRNSPAATAPLGELVEAGADSPASYQYN